MAAPAISGTIMLAELEQLDELVDDRDVPTDLGYLTLFDAHPIDPAALAAAREPALEAAAAANAQRLVRAIFALPRETTPEVGIVALLPLRVMRLPRELPPPAPKAPTKWEQFAKQKGIAPKGKRDRMIYDAAADEGKGEYAPRYGYKRVRAGDTEPIVYELNKNDDLKTDHLERISLEKRFKVTTNQLNRTENAERATNAKHGKAGLRLSAAGDKGDGAPLKRGKKAKREAAREARDFANDAADGVRRAPAGIPSIPIQEGRSDALAGSSKQPRMRPSDSLSTKTAQVSHAQNLTASMGKVRPTSAKRATGSEATRGIRAPLSASRSSALRASPPPPPAPVRQSIQRGTHPPQGPTQTQAHSQRSAWHGALARFAHPFVGTQGRCRARDDLRACPLRVPQGQGPARHPHAGAQEEAQGCVRQCAPRGEQAQWPARSTFRERKQGRKEWQWRQGRWQGSQGSQGWQGWQVEGWLSHLSLVVPL